MNKQICIGSGSGYRKGEYFSYAQYYQYDDGGRSDAGYKGTTRDCVTRAIAIATQLPYKKVYNDLNTLAKQKRTKRKSNSRTGIHRNVYQDYLKSLGWEWVPTMKIGTGCTTHLACNELPSGRIICRLSRHLVAVIDGVIHDTYQEVYRDGERCVYGYFIKN